MKDNASACLMIMNTPEYKRSIEELEINDDVRFTKATKFDIFQNEVDKRRDIDEKQNMNISLQQSFGKSFLL